MVANIKSKMQMVVTGALLLQVSVLPTFAKESWQSDSLVDVRAAHKQSWLSLQQVLKGTTAGLYVQEPSGEPGTKQAMFLRGSSVPLLGLTSYYETQPAVYVNGIPVIDDNTFVYRAKNSQLVAPGTASNVYAGIDLSNITSIEVIKDPVRLAMLGPLAANGAIWIETADRFMGGNHVNIAGSLSAVETNGLGYRFNATVGNKEKFANYLFTVGTTRSAGVADKTSYNKYNVGFYLNMSPISGLDVNTQIQVAKSGRNRNRSMRERLSEMDFAPTVSTMFPFTSTNVDTYYSLLDDSKDDNDNMQLHGRLELKFHKKALRLYGGAYFDYITNSRSVFWPSQLMENVNFASDFSGYNRRFYGQGGIGYDFHFNDKHLLKLDWTGTVREDKYHYTYDRGYDGEDDKKQSTNSGGYKQYYAIDQLRFHQFSSVFTLQYEISHLGRLSAVLRQDASSAVNKDHRWLVTPAASGEWDVKSSLGLHGFDALSLSLSWSRIGKYFQTDEYGMGPIYNTLNANYGSEVPVGSYYGFATISRPYSTGWVGYNMKWPVAEKWEVNLKGSLLSNRLNFGLALYKNNDKDIVSQLPVAKEYGYKYLIAQGIKVSNQGAELTFSGMPILTDDWKWNIGLNLAYNDNSLSEKVLPSLTGGLNSKLMWKLFDLSASLFLASGQKAVMADGSLEDASYAKLRQVTLGYNVPLKKRTLYIYGSANNLFTLSSFSGSDPELIDFDGVYRGYGMKIPFTLTLGFKMTL